MTLNSLEATLNEALNDAKEVKKSNNMKELDYIINNLEQAQKWLNRIN